MLLPFPFPPPHPDTDPSRFHRLRCFFDRADNLRIARAPAEVSGDRQADFVIRRIGISIEKGLGGKDHPRRAEAALRRAFGHKSILQRMELSLGGHPFDGRDLFPIGLNG